MTYTQSTRYLETMEKGEMNCIPPKETAATLIDNGVNVGTSYESRNVVSLHSNGWIGQ